MSNISFPEPDPLSAVFPRIVAHVLAELDASGLTTATWPDTSDDDAYSIDWVRYNIAMAAGALGDLLLNADGHPNAGEFLTERGPYTHGEELPSYIGNAGSAFVAIDGSAYRLAYQRPIEAIELMRRRGIVLADRYYGISTSGHIFFTGPATAPGAERIKIWLGIFDVLEAPFWDQLSLPCQDWIACRALSRLFAQAGDFLGAAGHFNSLWLELVASVSQKRPMPQYVPPNRTPE